MSQDYLDDVFGSTQQVQANMLQIEKNFACLKSSFSGPAAPPDPVAGMPWLDTTAHIWKLRNEANNAWISIWDVANNKPVAEITLAMMAASAADAAAIVASLRTIGTGALQACAGNDARLSDQRVPTNGSVSEAKLAASSVAQSKLKTSAGETSISFTQCSG